MSWSVTVNNFSDATWEEVIAHAANNMQLSHFRYMDDMKLAFDLGKELGLRSAALTGMRTSSPYNDDEVVDISVRGTMVAPDFNEYMKAAIGFGPDDLAKMEQANAIDSGPDSVADTDGG